MLCQLIVNSNCMVPSTGRVCIRTEWIVTIVHAVMPNTNHLEHYALQLHVMRNKELPTSGKLRAKWKHDTDARRLI